MGGFAARVRRDSLGVEVGCPVEGSAGAIFESHDVLAKIAAVGRTRRVAEDVARVSEGSGCRGATPLERVFHRRELRPREKGGAAVGKTKRGKGS